MLELNLPPPPSRRFLLFGIIASTCYSFSYIFVRHLGAEGLHPFQIVFFRTAICTFLLFLLTLSLRHSFRAKRPGKILLRGCLSAFGLLLWFYGLVHLPLAEATSLSLTTICFATVGAAVFLGEQVTRFRGLAILAALCGALAIIRPGVDGLQPEALAVLGAAACWGMAAVLVRSASRSEEPLTIALWTSAVITVFSLPAALPFWVWPIGWQWAGLSAIGVLTALGTLSWTTAFRHGQTTQVIITDFVQLVWGVLIGFAAGEFLEGWSVFGIVLITSATLLVAFDKAVNRP